MTGAAQENKNQRNMRTTHPAYREYSWESLTGTIPRQGNGRAQGNNKGARAQSRRATQASHAIQTPRQAAPNNIKNAQAGVMTDRTPVGQVPSRQAPARPNNMAPGAVRRGGMPKSAPRGGVSARPKPKAPAKPPKEKKTTKQWLTGLYEKWKESRTHIIITERKYNFPLSIIFIALTISILVMLIVTASVRISEVTTENSALRSTYNSLVSEQSELRTKLESRDDLRVVEEKAKNELGMVKKDQVPKYYLTIRNEDKIEIVDEKAVEKTGVLEKIIDFGNNIVDRVKAFFGR